MNLYEVFNGYTGGSAIRCIVIAENKITAYALASKKFKEDAEIYSYNKKPSRYWEKLEVNLLTNINGQFAIVLED
ncbi:hypothetical protein [Paenibacillus sp. FSL H3-0333]|uniref:hypothetical protein n=1 Tax=Paenibacillus sp. FSL H3-0333 TaxID=2921373 RepID=UPI0030FBD4D6